VNSGNLHIHRLATEYFIPNDHPDPLGWRSQCDGNLERHLLPELQETLNSRLNQQATDVWLIKHLAINFEVNTAWEPAMLTHTYANQIGQALEDLLAQVGDGENVLWFPNWAAFLARFLLDLASGHAWNRWYYQSFAGLRALSTSAGLRTALERDGEAGLEALLQLGAQAREVLEALNANDARRVLEYLSQSVGDETVGWLAVERALQTPTITAKTHPALALYLNTCALEPTARGRTLRLIVTSLIVLQLWLHEHPARTHATLIQALEHNNLADLYRLVGSEAERLSPLLGRPHEWLQKMVAHLGGAAHPTAGPTIENEARDTHFGGLFLLLPQIDEFPWQEASRDWPDLDDVPAALLLRFLVLIKCCGTTQASRAFYDPVWRDLMLIPPTLDMASLHAWQRQIRPLHKRQLLETNRRYQHERHRIGDHLVLARVRTSGQPRALLLEATRGLWMDWITTSRSEHLTEWLSGWLSQSKTQAKLWLDPTWQNLVNHDQLRLHLAPDLPDGMDPQRLTQIASDLEHIALPKSFAINPNLDRCFSILTQNMLRHFAWKLPGFATSGFPYLQHNFLEFSASIETQETHHLVRLGKPPLHLILHMTGLNRNTYRLNGHEHPFELWTQ
jgi:hypothetical protein